MVQATFKGEQPQRQLRNLAHDDEWAKGQYKNGNDGIRKGEKSGGLNMP
jgi:hypothetical protein